MPRKQRSNSKSVADRFEPPNEAIVCPLHGSMPLGSNGHSQSHSQVSRQGSLQSNGSYQNGHSSSTSLANGNGQLSRKSSQCSNGSTSRKLSHESYESALSSTTLRSHLAQPEEVDEYGDGDEEHAAGEDGIDGTTAGTRAECTRFTRQALYTYRAKNHLIHYKYSAYGGNCHDLPR